MEAVSEDLLEGVATAPTSALSQSLTTDNPAAQRRAVAGTSKATGGLGGPVVRDPELAGDGARRWPVAPVVPGPQSTNPRPPASASSPATSRSAPPPSSSPSEAGPPSEAEGDGAPPTTRSQPPSSQLPRSQAGRGTVEIPKQPKLPKLPQESSRGSALIEQSAELDRLRRAATRDEERIKTLVNQADSLRNRLEEAENRVAEGQRELDKLRNQHDSLRSLTAVRAERIRELEQTHGGHERRVEQLEARLERELGEQTERHRSELAALKQAHQREIDELKAQLAQSLARKTPSAPPPPDDLRAIYGIGPKFEKLLHQAGITRFSQIAGWSDEDIERIAETISTKAARIRKAGWVDSAKALLTQRDGDGDGTEDSSPGSGSDVSW